MTADSVYEKILKLLSYFQLMIGNSNNSTMTDIDHYAEDVFARILNIVYGFSLVNQNAEEQNVPGIDLVDRDRHVVVQVSATADRKKIRHSLSRIPLQLGRCHFLFFCTAGDAKNLRKGKYETPSIVSFDPRTDIIDIPWILQQIQHLEPKLMNDVLDCLSEYLELPTKVLPTELASVVNSLSKGDLGLSAQNPMPFEIADKIGFNKLNEIWFDSYSGGQATLKDVYETFAENGLAAENIIIARITNLYLEEKRKGKDSMHILLDLQIRVADEAIRSGNIDQRLTRDTIQMCAGVLIFDAFVKCRIFDRPPAKAEGGQHVAS